MNFKYLIIILTILFSFSCTNKSSKERVFQDIIETTLVKHPKAIGIMVHVEAPDQSISWSGSVGYSNWDKTQIIETDQPALIASMTKNYVAVSILRLVEQGKIDLFQSIKEVLSKNTSDLMLKSGFDISKINIAQLLGHKGGIQDYYDNPEFENIFANNPNYKWTRDEQINLAIALGPRSLPETSYNYSDTNYLLLTEILEQKTGVKYYQAIKELIDYNKLKLEQTWFYSLEPTPSNTKPLIHQYRPSLNDDSYKIHPSVDLYGGGGIAATTKDVAKYAQNVFEGNVFENNKTLDLMFTDIETKEGNPFEENWQNIPCDYYLGIFDCGVDNINSYWHSGYWGTIFRYFPEINATVVFYVINGAEFPNIEIDLMNQIITTLK